MATRNFIITKDQSLLDGTSPNSGSGKDWHAPMGENDSGQRFKWLLRFPHDWSGMTTVTKVELFLRTTGGVHIGSSKWFNGWFRMSTVNSSWPSGGGGENNWRTDASTIWPGPGTRGLTDKYFGDKNNPNTWVSWDITDLYMQVVPTGLGGLGKDNYGMVINSASDTNPVTEFWGLRATNSNHKPYLKITFTENVDASIYYSGQETNVLTPAPMQERMILPGDPRYQVPAL